MYPFCIVKAGGTDGSGAAATYKHHFRKPKGLPKLEDYNMGVVPTIPPKYKTVVAPKEIYEKEFNSKNSFLPKAEQAANSKCC